MEFLIQHNLINETNLLEIKYALNDIPHDFIGVIPFSEEITSEKELIGTDYIPYGSTRLTELSYEKKWKGCHFDLAKFDYKEFCGNRDDMLNDEICCNLVEAVEFLKNKPEKELFFTRPTKDLKQFSGTVMEAKEMYEWFEDMLMCASSGSYKLEADTGIVLATPKNILAEWRYFVIDGKVVDGSQYKHKGQLYKVHEKDKDVLKEAQSFADKWLPDSCVCMDLALIDSGEMKVIEFNCINSSGFYMNNIETIFKEWWKFHS